MEGSYCTYGSLLAYVINPPGKAMFQQFRSRSVVSVQASAAQKWYQTWSQNQRKVSNDSNLIRQFSIELYIIIVLGFDTWSLLSYYHFEMDPVADLFRSHPPLQVIGFCELSIYQTL